VTAPALGYIHRFEPAASPTAPTLLLLHGTGGDENDLLPLGPLLAPGAGLLSPRGSVLERGMPRFFRRFAEGVFDVDDVKRRAIELAVFVRGASAHYGFAMNAVIAVGFSNGANIAGAVLLLEPGLLRGAVLLRAQDVLGGAGLGARRTALGNTPVFLAGGKSDPIVPVAETEKLAALLRARGADVTVRWDENGHAITEGDVDAARDWLAGISALA
jgi:phospholipase/carboxylesterase